MITFLAASIPHGFRVRRTFFFWTIFGRALLGDGSHSTGMLLLSRLVVFLNTSFKCLEMEHPRHWSVGRALAAVVRAEVVVAKGEGTVGVALQSSPLVDQVGICEPPPR